jgi:hypothetical protein
MFQPTVSAPQDRPPLELILIAEREIASAIRVFRRAVDFKLRPAFVAILQPLFDQRDREMCDVASDPFVAPTSAPISFPSRLS